MSHSINIYWLPMKSGEEYPYACTNWKVGKRMMGRKYSLQKYGAVGAVAKCIEAREQSTGKPLGVTAQQVLDQLGW